MNNQNPVNIKGVLLALNTAIMWGLLPLALKSVLSLMDAATITWFRFLFSTLIVGILLTIKGKIPTDIFKQTKQGKLIFLAAIFLSLNYICYSISLLYVHAETAQMLIQMAPLFMTIASIYLLNEHFSRGQFLGSMLVVIGLLLFFNQQFTAEISTKNNNIYLGFAIMLIASLAWAAYAIIQKMMLKHYSSNQIMWLIYLLSSLFFLPLISPAKIQNFDIRAIILLFFCCTNTLLAYGSFAKAQQYLPTVKVSAIIATTPLLTVLFASITEHYFPNFFQAQALNLLAYIGSAVVVIGSIFAALGDRKSKGQSS